TEYLPGAAIGVAVVGPMPQCVTKRTSLPEKSGSDEVSCFSVGVLGISTIFAGSYIKFQDTWFRPGRAPENCWVRITSPAAFQISLLLRLRGPVATDRLN